MNDIVSDSLGIYMLFLFDYRKYGPIQNDLDAWLLEHGATREGLVVYYDDPAFEILFKLVWG
jgi:hypothetical protein